MRLKALSAALLLAGSASAFAVGPSTLGPIDNISVVIGNNVAAGVFVDTYMFAITNPGTVFGGAFPVYITSFSAVLQSPVLGTIGTDSNPTDGFSFTGLTPGLYALQFTGSATGSAAAYGGVISTVTSPVPEPETYALMLAGLGIMGFVATRRRSQR